MIQYAIDAAQNTPLFERIVVTTDDNEIGNLAAKLGCVYYQRPSNLEGPSIGMADVVIDVLQQYQKKLNFYDYICMPYACSPFVTSKLLEAGYKKLIDGQYDVVYPTYRGPFIERVLMIRDDETLSRFPQYDTESSNFWPDAYFHAGIFFWARVSSLLLHKNFMRGAQCGLIIKPWEAVDIDTPEDWEWAEILYKAVRKAND